MAEKLLIRIAFWGGLYLLINLYAFIISDRLLFQPQSPGYTKQPNEVKITTPDGDKITAVYLNHPDAEFTLLFSHGNAEDLERVAPFMQQYYDRGFSVLMYDYRGYGTSEGKPTYRNILRDASAAYCWLTEQQNIDPQSIIAHGRSLGGAVACWTAAHHEVAGLVIESSFTSAFRVKTKIPLLPWDKFNSVKWLKKIHCPVLISHGTEDDILPFWHGKKLYKAASEPKQKFWIEGAQHMNYAYVAEEAYFDTVLNFIQTCK